MMKKANVLWVVAFGILFGAANAFGQQRVIQPSPAYRGATSVPQAPAVRPVPVAAQPQVVAPVAQPVYYNQQPAQPVYAPQPRQMTLAPVPAY